MQIHPLPVLKFYFRFLEDRLPVLPGEESLAHVELVPAEQEPQEKSDGDESRDNHPEHEHVTDHRSQ